MFLVRSKKYFLVMSMVVLLCLVLTGCGQQADDQPAPVDPVEEPMVLRLAENQPADYPTTLGAKEFARLVEERTDGRIKINVFHSAQLGDERSVIEAIQMGGIDFARVNTQPMGEFSPGMRALALPFLFDCEDHLWRVLKGSVGEELLADLSASNMIGLAYYESGARSFYNSVRPIETPADLEGLKIRVQQAALMVDLVEALGGSATPMPFGEVYTAIQTGVIDGAENNWPSYFATSHYEVARYYTVSAHTRSPEVLIASKALWDRLSEEDQKIVRQAALDSIALQRASWQEWVEKAIAAVIANGNVIIEIEDLTPWQEAVAHLHDKHGAGFEDIIERIKAER